MIGQKIHLYRQAKGWTLGDFSAAITDAGGSLTTAALSKIERGLIQPRPTSIKYISLALGIKALDLLYTPEYEIVHLAYRKRTGLTKTKQSEIRIKSEERLQNYAWLLERMGIEFHHSMKIVQREVRSPEEAEMLATDIRKEWNLGAYPIRNLMAVLEENGIVLLPISSEKTFDGLSSLLKDKETNNVYLALITYKTEDNDGDLIDGERLRFTLAHELGHILMKSTGDLKLDEKLANRFAGAFLMPEALIIQFVGHKRDNLEIEELIQYKKYFLTSMQAIIYRLKDLNIISSSYADNWFKTFSAMGCKKHEPEALAQEKLTRFPMLVKRAIAERKIYASQAKEKFNDLDIEIKEEPRKETFAQKLRKMSKEERERILIEELSKLGDDYYNDPELKAFREAPLDAAF